MAHSDSTVAAEALPQPSPFYRWAVLVVISLAMFGNYYVYDSIAPIADMLKDSLSFTDENIGRLYSAYSWAAVIVLLLGGVIIDRWGTAKSTVLFGSICTLAAILNAVTDDLWIMVVARFLLGIGSEPLIVAITTALAKWFKGKELSFAFGINLTIARLGSVAADWSPTWAKWAYDSWQMPLVVAAVIGLLCLVSTMGYGALEWNAGRKYGLGKAGETDKLVLGDMFRFTKSYWFITLLCVTFYSAIFPFRSFAIKFFIEAHGLARDVAGQYNSLLPLAAMVATPLFGILVDRLGRRALFMVAGGILLLPVYIIMAYQLLPLGVPIAMMGIAFSLIPAVMWPSVAYIVEERRLGTAYAVMTLIQQIGVAAMNQLIGKANDIANASEVNPLGYAPGMWVFSTLGFLALLFAWLLRRSETRPDAHGLETITAEGVDVGRFRAAIARSLQIGVAVFAIPLALIVLLADGIDVIKVVSSAVYWFQVQFFCTVVVSLLSDRFGYHRSLARTACLYLGLLACLAAIAAVLQASGVLSISMPW